MPKPIRLLIADDHQLVREGLRTLLTEDPGIEVIGEARTGKEAVKLASDLRPDVVLMDMVMPELDGIQATEQIRAAKPATQVLVLTSFIEEGQVQAAVQAGAIGYLMKDILKDELVAAIRAAHEGRPTLHPDAQQQLMRQVSAPVAPNPFQNLTERELDVLRLIAEGQSNKEIASSLGLTEGTVKGYVSAIFLKLDVADRTQAALYAVRNGLE
jgi:DNA-binding NarL/FixJ family response regulator